MSETSAPSAPADVCLILEGTYPYVKGGVSEWTHQLIRQLPDRTFHLWCIVPYRKDAKPIYDLPPNVSGVTDVFLYEDPLSGTPLDPESSFWEAVRTFHQTSSRCPERAKLLWQDMARALSCNRGSLPLEPLLLGPKTYGRILELYDRRSSGLSFIDYYYTYLFGHYPLFRLIGEKIPPARLYHTVATGYAGFAGSKARHFTHRPLILTEHGIYTNERQVEIILADWIYSPMKERIQIGPLTDSLKRIWMEIFEFLGRHTYDSADHITTLFEGNARIQVQLGAAPEKIEVVPNGVDLSLYSALPRTTDPSSPLIALVGRVVAIKDLRTFIRACRIVADRIPGARFVVYGPTDQSDGYYHKCLDYRRQLGLEDRLAFAGTARMIDHYPAIDALALTSISEGHPLVVLEAMASGIPVVATRVGACPELLAGASPDDRAIGPSGILADVGDHEAIGSALASVVTDPQLAARLSSAGKERTRRFYDLKQIVGRYGEIYERWLAKGPVS